MLQDGMLNSRTIPAIRLRGSGAAEAVTGGSASSASSILGFQEPLRVSRSKMTTDFHVEVAI
jgi:hypothetical protein